MLNYVHNLAVHAQGLPVTAAATYNIWQAVGIASLVLGFSYNSAPA
ncbi:hypothetical protein ABT187_46675 [Streptomyces sp. NPDC001817]